MDAGTGEDDVEVADRQQLCFTLGEPLLCGCALTFWAMPVAAAVIGDHGVRAVLATCDMATERRGTATLDGRHHLQLVKADMAGLALRHSAPRSRKISATSSVGRDMAGAAAAPCRRVLSPVPPGPLARQRQQVERALDAGDHAGSDAGVACRRVQFVVTQQRLE